ncbi:MAG TPA: histidine kinase dimerization/phospho-acceptor domain-containing protein, partial [Dyadobacter sp.]|nr:histidine kinase dimerization/phospho-acceptor domain-containing protein [Dyadobacter sp.]
MMKQLYPARYSITHRTILVLGCLMYVIMGCQKTHETNQTSQLDILIDSLDRNSRKIGIHECIVKLDSFMAASHHISFQDRVSYYKFMKVLSHRDSSLAENALMYTDSLLQLFAPMEVRKEYVIDYSKALLLKGDDLLLKKKYYQAYRYYDQGKSFLIGQGEVCECARYSSRIANSSFREENYYLAIQYWMQEYKELAKCKKSGNFQLEFIERQGSLRNIGFAYLYLDKPDMALRYLQKAEDFIDTHAVEFPREKNYIKFAKIVILRNQAEAYALKGEAAIAEKLLLRCLKHDEEIDWSVEVEQESRLILAKLYVDTKRYDKAQPQLDIAQTLLNTSYNASNFRQYRKLKAAVLFGQQNFEDAGKLMIAIMESDRVDKLRKNAENKSDVGQLLQQIQREREIELEAEKDVRENLVLAFSILISIALSIIVYLIWRSASKSRRNWLAVTELNKTITQSNIVLQDTVNALEQTEIENSVVLKIVAHDLRSPIAAIMSASEMVFWDEVPTEDQQEMIAAIRTSGERANALISQILQSSSARNDVVLNEVALNEIIQSCIDMLAYKASEKQQILECNIPKVTALVDR